MAEKESKSEKIAPMIAQTSMVSSSSHCPWLLSNRPLDCMMRMNSAPTNAPNTMIPSSARLMTPLRSANTPASATISSGTA